jgi:hypothetical protein
MADGIAVQHVTARSRVCLVELRDRPYLLSYGAEGVCDGRGGRPLIPAPILDCSCGVPHEYKTVHVHVDDTGQALVSEGVWDMIRSAGETGFSVVGHTPNPPTIRLGVPRYEVDYDNRAYRPLTPMKTGGAN